MSVVSKSVVTKSVIKESVHTDKVANEGPHRAEELLGQLEHGAVENRRKVKLQLVSMLLLGPEKIIVREFGKRSGCVAELGPDQTRCLREAVRNLSTAVTELCWAGPKDTQGLSQLLQSPEQLGQAELVKGYCESVALAKAQQLVDKERQKSRLPQLLSIGAQHMSLGQMQFMLKGCLRETSLRRKRICFKASGESGGKRKLVASTVARPVPSEHEYKVARRHAVTLGPGATKPIVISERPGSRAKDVMRYLEQFLSEHRTPLPASLKNCARKQPLFYALHGEPGHLYKQYRVRWFSCVACGQRDATDAVSLLHCDSLHMLCVLVVLPSLLRSLLLLLLVGTWGRCVLLLLLPCCRCIPRCHVCPCGPYV
jgi:hypothetical protein